MGLEPEKSDDSDKEKNQNSKERGYNDGFPEYKVSVKEPAKEGRANWAVERALAKHFNVSPSRVRIVSGQTSKTKIVEIIDKLS